MSYIQQRCLDRNTACMYISSWYMLRLQCAREALWLWRLKLIKKRSRNSIVFLFKTVFLWNLAWHFEWFVEQVQYHEKATGLWLCCAGIWILLYNSLQKSLKTAKKVWSNRCCKRSKNVWWYHKSCAHVSWKLFIQTLHCAGSSSQSEMEDFAVAESCWNLMVHCAAGNYLIFEAYLHSPSDMLGLRNKAIF